MPEDVTRIMVLPGVTLHVTARYFPVVIATWFGTPTVEAVERYADWLATMSSRAKAEGTKVVIIGDTTASGRPGPDVRRGMARALERLGGPNREGLMGGSTIIGHPLMRAVLSIVMAITREKIDLKPVKSLEAAFDRTRELLDEAGIPWPEGLDLQTYQRPTLPDGLEPQD
ncbi:MAG: hypothetical protein KDK70_32805 [Myxococcales bacterium]|nr:hypothetical protein [Myxococcales bacterium]